jgi:type II secretory pathway pseudopilin PulG
MRGFTLIESIIYLALLSFIMTSVLLTVFMLMQSGAKLDTKTATQDEGNFVMRKLDWVFGSVSSIGTPPAGYLDCVSVAPGATCLSFTQYDVTTVQVRLNSGKIEMKENNNANGWLPLTTDNVKVSDLGFMRISGSPLGIEASTTINGITFTTRKYLRQ